MITRPYTHAGLAAGELQTGRLGDENVDISFGFECVSRTRSGDAKIITCVRFGGPRWFWVDKRSSVRTKSIQPQTIWAYVCLCFCDLRRSEKMNDNAAYEWLKRPVASLQSRDGCEALSRQRSHANGQHDN